MRMTMLMSFTSAILVGSSYNDKVPCTAGVPFLFDASVRSFLSARAQDKWARHF